MTPSNNNHFFIRTSRTSRTLRTSRTPLKRMRAVRTNRKLDLEQELICRRADRPVGESILPAHLAELARPVREDARPPAVVELCVGRTVRSIETHASEPASCKLILT